MVIDVRVEECLNLVIARRKLRQILDRERRRGAIYDTRLVRVEQGNVARHHRGSGEARVPNAQTRLGSRTAGYDDEQPAVCRLRHESRRETHFEAERGVLSGRSMSYDDKEQRG